MAAKTKQPLPTKTANNKSMTEKPILYYDYLLETNDISLQSRKWNLTFLITLEKVNIQKKNVDSTTDPN